MNLIIVGDFCPNARLASVDLRRREVISPDISAVIHGADYSLVNLESPVAIPTAEPIPKQGPNLKCISETMNYLKSIGFSALTLANNHIRDFGDDSLLNTIECAKQNGLDYVGAGLPDDPMRETLYVRTSGETIAIVNCCENEFSVTDDLSIGTNPLDPIRQFRQIQAAKKMANYVVVIVHGGIEHFQYPSFRMKETYRFFIEAGADTVINHHQHCYSGYEVYRGKPILYGLGNFCFDWEGKRKLPWNEGFMVRLSFGDEITFKLYPYVQCDERPVVELMGDTAAAQFNEKITQISETIKDDDSLKAIIAQFYTNTEQDYRLALEPYSSRIGVALYRRNLLPSFVSKGRILKLYDYVMCESHRERLKSFLRNQYSIIKR